MKQKIIIGFLVLTLLLTPSTVVADSNADTIKDIQDHWAKDAILALTEEKIIGGYPDGTFRPDDTITVAEFSKVISTTIGDDVGVATNGNWFNNYVVDLMSRNIIREGEFYNYNRNITRGEIARMVVRALGEEPREGESNFNDFRHLEGTEIGAYVNTATDLKIINGYPDNRFRPHNTATRAETATIITKMLVVIDQTDNWQPPKKVSDNVDAPPNANAFIEPVIITNYDTSVLIMVEIENFRDFNDDYEFSIKCTNYLQLNERQTPMASGGFSTVKDLTTSKKSSELISGRLFGLPQKYYTSQRYTNDISIEKGMEIDFIVTVKKGNEQREYLHSAVVK
ncbi:MAG: S-layer homology domain-containing protein [Clostridiaceae bacterium]|nr:S-layer homology domain-containing protein [Clostridiaceae bacterium]